MMNLSSSFDHRVVDGYDAAEFIQKLKRLLGASGNAVHHGMNACASHITTKVLVVGGGPGGYVAAIRARRSLASTRCSSKPNGSAAPASSAAAFRPRR